MSTDEGLLERENELACIDHVLSEAFDGRGRMLMIDGEAGVGKSTLLRAARAAATDRGFAVLRARGGEHESDLGFGVAQQLFSAYLDRPDVFSGAAGSARTILSDSKDGGDNETATFAAQNGLFWLTANIASSTPVLINIDDAQWVDLATLRFIHFLVRRIDDMRVGVILATRTGETTAVTGDLRALRLEPESEVIEPSPLSVEAARRLVTDATGRTPDDDFVDACQRVTGGNPFLIGELVRAMRDDDVAPTRDQIDLVERMGARRVSSYVLLRLSRLGEGAADAARAASVLGTSLDVRRVRELSGLDAGDARTAINALVAGGILTDRDGLDFVHPVVRATVYDDLPAADGAELHLKAAKLLDHDGARDEAAVHLLLAERNADPWVVDRLLVAGRRARSRGAVHEAARLLTRALTEPPEPVVRASVLVELGVSERLAGEAGATDHLREARALASSPADVERAANELAYVVGLAGDIDGASSILEEAIDELRTAAPERAMRLEETLISLLVNDERHIKRGTERLLKVLPTVAPDSRTHRALLGLESWSRFESGTATVSELEAITTRSLADDVLLDEIGPDALPLQAAITGLQRCDRIDLAEPIIERVLIESRRKGALFGVAAALTLRAHAGWISGDLRSSEQDANEAVEYSLLAQSPYFLAAGLSIQAASLVEQARLDEAEALLNKWGFMDLDPPTYVLGRFILYIRARLHFYRRRFDVALVDALEALRRDRERFGGKARPFWGLYNGALALHYVGRQQEAEEVCAEYVERAHQWELGSEIGMAARVSGVVHGDEHALEVLPGAIELLAASPRRLEHAQALADYGAALRRAGRRSEARDPLREAIDIAMRCGGAYLVEATAIELEATGARSVRRAITGPDSLTTAERRVAELATDGMSNPEIAATLVVSRKTVESHLRTIFRKLHITARAELPQALGV